MATLARTDVFAVAMILQQMETALEAKLGTPACSAETVHALTETRRLCRIFDKAAGRCLDFTRTD